VKEGEDRTPEPGEGKDTRKGKGKKNVKGKSQIEEMLLPKVSTVKRLSSKERRREALPSPAGGIKGLSSEEVF